MYLRIDPCDGVRISDIYQKNVSGRYPEKVKDLTIMIRQLTTIENGQQEKDDLQCTTI